MSTGSIPQNELTVRVKARTGRECIGVVVGTPFHGQKIASGRDIRIAPRTWTQETGLRRVTGDLVPLEPNAPGGSLAGDAAVIRPQRRLIALVECALRMGGDRANYATVVDAEGDVGEGACIVVGCGRHARGDGVGGRRCECGRCICRD